MKSLLRVLILPSLLLILGACASSQTIDRNYAENSGFGGTGKTMAVAAVDAEWDQVGHSSSGFGGTGIIGTVEAFGSIWVNDIEIAYPQDVALSSKLQTALQLKLGQQVILKTLDANDRTMTREIEIYYPLAGRIEEVQNGRIKINRQWVYWQADTPKDTGIQLERGSFIAVNAIPQNDGSWQATRLNLNPSQQRFNQLTPEVPEALRYVVQSGFKRLFEDRLSSKAKIEYRGREKNKQSQNALPQRPQGSMTMPRDSFGGGMMTPRSSAAGRR
ncbi:DUF5666 domain-containing protein [Thiomicrorhabdus heinhorstiae]|uniref:DUF5666 domain-containing protein n=1 Tax=Thiomicrorhabdus heinhorstiae TaxID=2748010 RepID=A0ABS0BWQ5_9GAMM|nr:DUF5666 domain-containing protein [Thiomicrorhabdus heinhorstiae]MBF6058241.1 hypothetical protein [Thiomicrorhabdus heinhorstiae]